MKINNPVTTKNTILGVILPVGFALMSLFSACGEAPTLPDTQPNVKQPATESFVYIINGEEQLSSFNINTLDQSKITSMHVYKGEETKTITQNVCDAIVKIEME